MVLTLIVTLLDFGKLGIVMDLAVPMGGNYGRGEMVVCVIFAVRHMERVFRGGGGIGTAIDGDAVHRKRVEKERESERAREEEGWPRGWKESRRREKGGEVEENKAT